MAVSQTFWPCLPINLARSLLVSSSAGLALFLAFDERHLQRFHRAQRSLEHALRALPGTIREQVNDVVCLDGLLFHRRELVAFIAVALWRALSFRFQRADQFG